MPQSDPVEILVIEDNPAEAELIQEAWRRCQTIESHVSVIQDSRAAIVYLRGQLEYAGQPHPRPHLVLVDYIMPVDGGIALTELKGDPEFRTIPIVALTASRNPRDHLQIYERSANCCFLKPDSLQAYFELICYLAEFWLKRAVPPPRIG